MPFYYGIWLNLVRLKPLFIQKKLKLPGAILTPSIYLDNVEKQEEYNKAGNFSIIKNITSIVLLSITSY